jgi:hypothetical protein
VAGPDLTVDQPPPVRFVHAIFARCPYCNTLAFLTPDQAEVDAATAAQIPELPVLNEAVNVGGDNEVHFVECKCGKHFVARMVLRNADAFRRYDEMRKYRPQLKRPEPRMTWAGATFQTWMLEVLANPNWMMRQKAQRECLKRGMVLDWDSVARQAESGTSA